MKDKKKFRIVISTDNHIGYKEDHDITGVDSFNAFDEVLQKAKQLDSNIVLLGGDLFHDATPSQSTLTKTADILFQNVLGDGNIDFSFEQKNPKFNEKNDDIDKKYIKPNFACEDMNIGLPIFIINGNHDYPTNIFEDTSPLDMLHNIKLLNYFGKSYENSKQIIVEPLLFQTNGEDGKKIKVAIYGIGYMKEVYLREIISTGNLIFKKPENYQDYINILVVHQNRFKGHKHGAPLNQTISEGIFETVEKDLFQIVIWGHEHECIGKLEDSTEYDYMVYQPGSTVATKLFEGEMKAKGFGVLDIYVDNQVKFEQHYLEESRRPFYYEHMDLKSINYVQEEALQKIEKKFKEILEIIQQEDGDVKPIIRIKVEIFSGDELRVRLIEEKYQNYVANPNDVIAIVKKQKKLNQNINLDNNINLNEEALMQKLMDKKTTDLGLKTDDINDQILLEFQNNVSKIDIKLFPVDLLTDIIERNCHSNRDVQKIEKKFFDHISQIQQSIDKETELSNKYLNDKYMKKIDFTYKEIQKNLDGGDISQQIQIQNHMQKSEYDEKDKQELYGLIYKNEAKYKMTNFQTQITNIISQQAIQKQKLSQQQNSQSNLFDELSKNVTSNLKNEDMEERSDEDDDFLEDNIFEGKKNIKEKKQSKKVTKKGRNNKKQDELNSSEDESVEDGTFNKLKGCGMKNNNNNLNQNRLSQFDQKNLKINEKISATSSKVKQTKLFDYYKQGGQQKIQNLKMDEEDQKQKQEDDDDNDNDEEDDNYNQFSKKQFNQKFLKQEASSDDYMSNEIRSKEEHVDQPSDKQKNQRNNKDPKGQGKKRKQESEEKQQQQQNQDEGENSNSNNKLTSKALTAQKGFGFKKKSSISNMFDQISRKH